MPLSFSPPQPFHLLLNLLTIVIPRFSSSTLCPFSISFSSFSPLSSSSSPPSHLHPQHHVLPVHLIPPRHTPPNNHTHVPPPGHHHHCHHHHHNHRHYHHHHHRHYHRPLLESRATWLIAIYRCTRPAIGQSASPTSLTPMGPIHLATGIIAERLLSTKTGNIHRVSFATHYDNRHAEVATLLDPIPSNLLFYHLHLHNKPTITYRYNYPTIDTITCRLTYHMYTCT